MLGQGFDLEPIIAVRCFLCLVEESVYPLLYALALGCVVCASWCLPGVVFSIVPWTWLVISYLWGLSSKRRGPETGPTGLVHGVHAPYVRDKDD